MMKKLMIIGTLGMAGMTVFSSRCVPDKPRQPQKPPVPLSRAHAHNDYEHQRPLLDALDYGFCSVEADIHLVDGKLLVAHDRDKVKPGQTLEALHMAPLRQRVWRNGRRVYRGGPELTLLIDVKSEWRWGDSNPRPVHCERTALAN